MLDRKVSLNEFIGAPPEESTPPRRVSVRFIGRIEVLKPIVTASREPLQEIRPSSVNDIVESEVQPWYYWIRRPLVLGTGMAAIAIVLLSVILIAIFEQPKESDLSLLDASATPLDLAADTLDMRSRIEEPSPVELTRGRLVAPRNARAIPTRKKRTPVGRRPMEHQPPQPRIFVSDFVPTTLVIYAENGEIKKRIEPNVGGLD
jgi:hypothetical protein